MPAHHPCVGQLVTASADLVLAMGALCASVTVVILRQHEADSEQGIASLQTVIGEGHDVLAHTHGSIMVHGISLAEGTIRCDSVHWFGCCGLGLGCHWGPA